MTDNNTELVMPLISQGSHDEPANGACFMEFVSYLAGEKWSDSPGCADPMLAAVMREINDRIENDAIRSQLTSLIPLVINSRLLYPSFGVYADWATEVVSRARAAGLLKWRRDLTGRRRSWNTEQLDSLCSISLWNREEPHPTLAAAKIIKYMPDEDQVRLAEIFIHSWYRVTEGQDMVYIGDSRYERKEMFPEAVTVMHELLRTAS